jgi:hypothetical protein
MELLMGLALAHLEEPPLHDLERICLPIHQDEQQSILRRGEGTVLRGALTTGGARLPIKAPEGHMGLKGGLKRRDYRLKLVHRETGQIEHLCRAHLQIGEASSSHSGGLLSSEAQDTINRDELYLSSCLGLLI